MKIAIFTDTYEPEINGIVTSTSTFAHLLAADGHKVIIFCPKYNVNKDPQENNLQIYRFRSFSLASNKNTHLAFPPISKILKILKEEKPDFVHIETPMSIGITGVIAAKILNLKNIQTYHTYLPDFSTYLSPAQLLGLQKLKEQVGQHQIAKNIKGSGFYQTVWNLNQKARREILEALPNVKIPKLDLSIRSAWSFTRTLYNKADLVLTPSKVLANLLKRHGVKPPVLVQTNGIQTKKIAVKRDYKYTGKIIHFGRLGLEKEIDVIIKAFEIALQRDENLSLDIIGDGPARSALEGLVGKKNLEAKVKFYGFMPHDEVIKKLKDYDLFVTASPMETQGLVILEAMAAGLPVVGVNMLAIPEVVKNGLNGYTVPRKNYKKMAEKMIEIVSNTEKQEDFGKASVKLAANHEIGHAYQQLLEKYNNLLDQSN